MSATETKPIASHDARRLLDDCANFEMAHALRLYCHAHAVGGTIGSFMLECSDAAMRRVDVLSKRVTELSGRARLPHRIQVPAIPQDTRVELRESIAAGERYNRVVQRADGETRHLFAQLREEHARESAGFAHLLQTKLD